MTDYRLEADRTRSISFHSSARWIRNPEAPQGEPCHIVFRVRFEVPSGPEPVVLDLAAQRDYEVRLNGNLLGRGTLCDPAFQRVDTYELRSLLHPGPNTLSLLVYTDGGRLRMTAGSGLHGVLCQVRTGDRLLLASNGGWETRLHRGWNRGTGVPFDDSTFPEFFDARADAPAWWEEESGWRMAAPLFPERNALWGAEIPQARQYPFVNLLRNEIPQLRHTLLLPSSILVQGEVLVRRSSFPCDTAVRMSLERVLPPEKTSIRNAEDLLRPGGECEIRNSPPREPWTTFDGLRAATIVFDFGAIHNGRFRIGLEAAAGTVIDIGYATHLEEGRVVPYRSHRTSQADQYVCSDGVQQWQTFQWRQFRYVQLTFRQAADPVLADPVRLREVASEKVEYPFDRRGAFSCSDSALGEAVGMCRRSAELCTVDRTMDNASRERKQYLGDCALVLPVLWQFFGNPAVVRKYFAQLAEAQSPTGLYRYSHPGHADDSSSLFDHALTFPIFLHEYWLHHGEEALASELCPSIDRLLRLALSGFDETGLAGLPPYPIWFDRAHLDRRDYFFPLNAYLCRALECGVILAEAAGFVSDAVNAARDRAAALRPRLSRDWFDEERGVFVDARDRIEQGSHVSEQTNSLAILWGFAEPEQTVRIIENFRRQPGLFHPASPAWAYLPSALIRGGATDLALSWLQSRVALLRAQGIETWPETWSLQGEDTSGFWRCRDSRAAAQSAGLSPALAAFREIAGLRPCGPAMSRILFAPRPGPLESFRVVFPMPQGELEVTYRREKEAGRYDLRTGADVLLLVSLPRNSETPPAGIPSLKAARDRAGLRIWESELALKAGETRCIEVPTGEVSL